MVLPNFLFIGAAKSGSTTIHYALDQHPEIFMCPVKEVGFFWAYGQEVNLQGIDREKLRYRVVNDLETYTKLFAGVTTEKAIGESSVRYFAHPQAPVIIKSIIPEARLILSLRQPADRAFSSFVHNIRDGLEPSRDFREAIEQERNGLRDDWGLSRYLVKGYYYTYLKRYLELFDRRQIHISLYEDLRDSSQELMREIFQFLEVDVAFKPDLTRARNVSGIIRNPILRFLWTHSNRIRRRVRPFIGSGVRHQVFERVIQDMDKISFSPELRAEITSYYYEEIQGLQDLIDRDLNHWLQPLAG